MRSSTSSICQPQPAGERAAHGRLSGRHETDQVDLVWCHAVSLARSSAKSGYETATAPAPVTREGPVRTESDQRERHDEAMVVRGVGGAAVRPAGAVDHEPIGSLGRIDAHARGNRRPAP